MKKIIISILLIIVLNVNYVFSVSYLYDTKDKFESSISSVETVASPEFNFESEAQLLMEPITGEIIYANNEEEELLPASVTKIMTLLLIMEQIDSGVLTYSDTVTCSKNASEMGGSQIWFKEGEVLTIDEALKAICVVSANDVTVAMAELIGGSEDNFVNMMNAKAKELGLTHTHYANCHGIDEDGHYTCAKDIAIIARELINKHPNILKYTSIWMDSLRGGEFGLNSTNKLIRFYDGATGLKTGYTSNAKYNLVGTATRGENTFISVILKAPSSDIRLSETKQLLDYAFLNYDVKKICSSETILDEFSVNKNINEKLKVKIADAVYKLVQKGENIESEEVISYEELKAPIEIGQVIGKIGYINKETNEKIGESNLVAINKIEKSKIMDYIMYVFRKVFQI